MVTNEQLKMDLKNDIAQKIYGSDNRSNIWVINNTIFDRFVDNLSNFIMREDALYEAKVDNNKLIIRLDTIGITDDDVEKWFFIDMLSICDKCSFKCTNDDMMTTILTVSFDKLMTRSDVNE